ncbi:MAG: 50S ribosomal protein L9 [Pseudomonadota bacterium]
MQVILKQKVESLGKAGDAVNVSDGYARNFLIPKGFAIEANFKNLSVLEREKKAILLKAGKEKKDAEALAERFKDVTCTIMRRVGEQNKLFGSVNVKDIHEALLAQGLDINRKDIVLGEPIKALGEIPVAIRLSAGVAAEIKVIVAAES